MTALPDGYSRLALADVYTGDAPTLQAAQARLAAYTIAVHAGPDACANPVGQAAILTAAATAARAVGAVPVTLAVPNQTVVRGPYQGRRLADAVADATSPHHRRLGGAASDPTRTVHLVVGDTVAPFLTGSTRLQITWDGWTAAVHTHRRRLAELGDQPLAGIAAATLAVSDAFAVLQCCPGATNRDHTVSLWNPLDCAGTDQSPEPHDLAWLPQAWHLVGLGHLGQAAAWCVAHLPYSDDTATVVLQDSDRLVPANISTGVLTDTAAIGRLKTRLVADHLEAAGLCTRLLERRLTLQQRREPDEPGLALIGVDNLETRRHLSAYGWDHTIDMGLGRGARDFTTLSIHHLDRDHPADAVTAWQHTRGATEPDLPDIPAFHAAARDGVDRCGLIQLAGTAVGASFVGGFTACLAVAEPLRRLAGADPIQVCTADVRRPHRLRGARGGRAVLPAALPAAPHIGR